ncbi:MAG: cytochrome c3 family protein [Deltaproteobacteria bacterium]|nr:cytochrome c3 family protein [Deltaproteobacteria bacterium]
MGDVMILAFVSVVGAAPAATTATPAQTAVPPDPESCLDCHRTSASEHLKDWGRSVHARTGVTCGSCHRTPPKPGEALPSVTVVCGRCHQDVEGAFKNSLHFKKAESGGRVPSCGDCHSSAGGLVLPVEIFAERCGRCHDDSGPAREDSISRRAIEILDLLRRVTLARALVGAEVTGVRTRGREATRFEADLAAVDRLDAGMKIEWHRFAFDEVEVRANQALTLLDSLHERIGEPQ